MKIFSFLKASALACIALGFAPRFCLADPLDQAMPSQGVPPREIVMIVRSAGLIPTSQPALAGATYVVRAVDPYGTPVQVMIDARNGYILSVRSAARYAPRQPWYRDRALGMREAPWRGDDMDDAEILPPRAIPGRAPDRPQTATPLPRPRTPAPAERTASPATPREPAAPAAAATAPSAPKQTAKDEGFPPVTPLQ